MSIYYAIIGDMISSKKIKERNQVQVKLNDVLKEINSVYTDDIAAKFLITLGDEFQGLLCHAKNLFPIIKYIQKKMYPTKLRFGIGIGEMRTEIIPDRAIGADGPAYYAARNAIQTIRKLEAKYKTQAPDIYIKVDPQLQRVQFLNDDPLYDKINRVVFSSQEIERFYEIQNINTMLVLMKTIEDGWSDAQRYTIWAMMERHESQESCARSMQVSQSTIARRLSDGKLMVYTEAWNNIDSAISRLDRLWK